MTAGRVRYLLVAVSGLQLSLGIAGQAVAVRRRLAYDVAILRIRGQPANVRRDSWLLGTALSAPIAMLALQAAATAGLAAGPDRGAARVLGSLGAAMVGGYLVERHVRHRLTRNGWDPAESSIAVAGLALAGGMAVLGLGYPGRPAPQS
jgi:hypothetical protein